MGLFSRKPKTPAAGSSMPATIEGAMADQAATFIGAFAGEGSPVEPGALDYSAASLGAVDGILGDFHRQGLSLPEDLHFLASAYVFEVARREFGGRYLRSDDPNPFVLVIGEPDFRVGVMVMEKITGRVTNGDEDSIPFFYEGIAPLVARRQDVTLV